MSENISAFQHNISDFNQYKLNWIIVWQGSLEVNSSVLIGSFLVQKFAIRRTVSMKRSEAV